MHWLLEPTALRRLIHAQENFRDTAALIQWEAAQAEAEQREASHGEGQLPAGMSVAGNTAEIRVEGVLTKRPDFWAKYFLGGNTTYSSIRHALGIAASSPDRALARKVIAFLASREAAKAIEATGLEPAASR